MIYEWVLILTLMARSDGGMSIHSVPGFDGSKACQEAGRMWRAGVLAVRNDYAKPSYVCVRRPKAMQETQQ